MASCLNNSGCQKRRDDLWERIELVKAKDRGKICDTPTDPSLEFDTFEYMCSKLTDAFIE